MCRETAPPPTTEPPVLQAQLGAQRDKCDGSAMDPRALVRFRSLNSAPTVTEVTAG